MVAFIQRSFAGGEISPEVGARADMVKYATGVQQCLNFRVMKYGGLQYSAGSYFITEVKDSSKKVRLIEFVFSTEVRYVLEFGDQYIRVIKDGLYVLDDGVPVEITTDYLEAELDDIGYAQSGDVMTIAHKNHPPAELSRVTETNWTLADIVFGVGAGPAIIVQSQGTLNGTNIYTYYVTAIKASGEETLVNPFSALATIVDAPDFSDTFKIFASTGGQAGATEYNFYRSTNGSKAALIAIAQPATIGGPAGITDNGLIEQQGVHPPVNKTVFVGAGNYPSLVTFYQQRRVFAATSNKPETVWMSRIGAFTNFNVSSPIQDDDGIEFTIAGSRFSRIMHLINIGRLVALTNDGEFVVTGSVGSAITPTSINIQQDGFSGSARLPPLAISNTIVHLQSRGNVVRNLVYQFETDGYAGRDLTVFANHLFDDYQIISWAYQQTPDSIIWAVRDDGKLLGLTYMPEHDVWGWHIHDTDGIYENVVAIPGDGIDVVYAVVRRYINGEWVRYIELFDHCKKDVIECFHVHSGLTYDGRDTGESITISAVSGSQATITYSGTLVSTNVGDAFFVGNLRLQIITINSATECVVESSATIPAELIGVAITDFSFAVDTFSGLDHLEGKVVSVVADGNVVFDGSESNSQFTVTSGQIVLPYPGAVVHIGLPYTGRIETLRLENVNNNTIINNSKLISKVAVMYESSRGMFIGSSFDRLVELKPRLVSDEYNAIQLRSELVEVAIQSRWETNAKVCIEHKKPLPLNIIAISPIGAIGGN